MPTLAPIPATNNHVQPQTTTTSSRLALDWWVGADANRRRGLRTSFGPIPVRRCILAAAQSPAQLEPVITHKMAHHEPAIAQAVAYDDD